MRLRAFITSLLALASFAATPAAASFADSITAAPATAGVTQTVDDTVDGSPPPSTFNEFYPDERPLGDCLNNSIPLPNCGSKARGGWGQNVVFLAILIGLTFIAWRIVATSRKARAALDRAPDAAGVPAGDDVDRAP